MYDMHNQASKQLTTERLVLIYPGLDASAGVLRYRELNRAHLSIWEPERPASFYTITAVETRLREMQRHMAEKTGLYWLIKMQEGSEIIGECSFTNIVQGFFQACHLGFSLASEYQGQGLMHEALKIAIADAFEAHALHRIMANYQPHNVRSGKLLQRLGFEKEGLAKKYLKINGRWADHILTSLIRPDKAGD